MPREKRTFLTTRRFNQVADKAKAFLHFENPEDSSVLAEVQVEVRGGGKGELDIYENIDRAAGATETTVRESTIGNRSTTTQCTVAHGGSYSPGADKQSVISMLDSGMPSIYDFIVEPGHSLLFQIKNYQGSNTTFSSIVAWDEEDV